jgi:membrane-associated phospholipid phosphatase
MKNPNILNIIGKLSPVILLVSSLYLLINKKTIILFYIIGFVVNLILNVVLKITLQHPRPYENKKKFYLKLKNGNKMNFHEFGMPSGHAQSAFYSTIFIHYVFNNISITLFYLFFSLLSCFEKVINNEHSVFQISVGTIIGLLVGTVFYKFSLNKIKEK